MQIIDPGEIYYAFQSSAGYCLPCCPIGIDLKLLLSAVCHAIVYCGFPCQKY